MSGVGDAAQSRARPYVLAALCAGALLYRTLFVLQEGTLAAGVAFAWAVTELPLAAEDFHRLRGDGDGPTP